MNRFRRFSDLEHAIENHWTALKNTMGYVVPKSSTGRGWLKQWMSYVMVDTLWRRFFPPKSTKAKKLL